MAIGVAVVGAAGRLGRLVVERVLAEPGFLLIGAFARPGSLAIGRDAGTFAGVGPCAVAISALGSGRPDDFGDAEVVIDVSSPGALSATLAALGGRALVYGVTGFGADADALLSARAGLNAVLVAPNFSAGATLLAHLAATAAAVLPGYEVEIVEIHHKHKRDAPSGTAKMLAAAVSAVREGAEVPTHSLRGGDVPGDHEVWLMGDGERLRLGHIATSRATFAAGAVRAAGWIAGKPPGRYALRDVLGLG